MRPLLGSRTALAVAAITALGGLLRFATLGRQSYWYDEAVTVGLVREPLLHMIRLSAGTESTPPLYYVVGWAWTKLFGTSEVGLRSLSATFGTLAIPAAFAAGRELVSARAGLLAAALTAASPFLVWYSQEARAYSLLVLLGAVSVALCGRALKRPTRGVLSLWAASAALALWTEYFALFLVAAEAAVLASSRRRRRLATLPFAGVGLAAVAVFPLAYHQANTSLNDWIGRIPLRIRLESAARWLVGGPFSTAHVWWTIGGVIVLGLGSVLLLSTRRERRSAALAAGLGGASFLLPLIPATLGSDYFLFRNVIAAWVPFAIALGAGLATEAPLRPWLRAVSVCAAVALVVLSTTISIKVTSGRHYARQDWRGVARCLNSTGRPRAILVSPAYERAALKLYLPSVEEVRHEGRTSAELDVIGQPASAFDPPLHLPRMLVPAGASCSDSIRVFRYRSPRAVSLRPPQRDVALLYDPGAP